MDSLRHRNVHDLPKVPKSVKDGKRRGGPKPKRPPEPPARPSRRSSRKTSTPSSLLDRKEADRITSLLSSTGSEKAPEWLNMFIQKVVPTVSGVVNTVGPYVVMGTQRGIDIYRLMPKNILSMTYGLTLCFFGGMFPLTLAASEAFYATGGGTVQAAIADLSEDLKELKKANDEDDKRDEDKDGIADVDMMDAQALLTRKIALILRTIDPVRFSEALEGLCSGIFGVLVVLKFQFARTVNLAVSIGNYMRPLAAEFIAPELGKVTAVEYQQWIMPCINYGCKAIAVSVAWYIQRVIGTIQSAIRGGLMCSRSGLKFATDKGLIPARPNNTYLDEIIGWGLAALGAYVQIKSAYDMPFILDIVLFPFSIAEVVLKYSVSWLNTQ